MKTEQQNFGIYFSLLLIAQMVIYNYFHLTELVVLSILPALILCVPLAVGTLPLMLLAFGTGLLTDALSGGLLGMNALALVPVALLRNTAVRIFISTEIEERRESFSIRKNGFGKISLALLALQAIFLFIYISCDSAGMRSFGFNSAKFFLSMLCSYILSIFTVNLLTSEPR